MHPCNIIKRAINCESNRMVFKTEGNCVEIAADEFKVSDSVSMKCSNLFYGCYSCDYKQLNLTIDVDNLECSACQSGMAFERDTESSVLQVVRLVQQEQIINTQNHLSIGLI
ncbi:hypothetical protein EIN_264630 [Entamoeba invadens IP1]|uniref:Uncharacterized protein n=1 Tax=Entamoeba invadens IP1 TaxID=370355 RepID=A0A0A1TWV6_ENTIV|nr:hypothetical protein EIN_264630 [Entamoeba invadens IP1]ELP85696.1 hypothetical protein EIN_264630 [Entamoeba invadens IP1]|eukprot:XP_004185042.1 hypothetical protein EIN_264630 [Entamoeba invadens IP1]